MLFQKITIFETFSNILWPPEVYNVNPESDKNCQNDSISRTRDLIKNIFRYMNQFWAGKKMVGCVLDKTNTHTLSM